MAFSNLIEQIEQGTGKFDLHKQYFVNNATDMDIQVSWALREPEAKGSGTYTIKAGEKGGPYQQFLAYHIVKELVSREMQRDGKAKFFGSAEMRKPYEEKFLIEINMDSGEDPFIMKIRDEERAKLLKEIEGESQGTADKADSAPEKRKYTRRAKEEPKVEEEFAGANRG